MKEATPRAAVDLVPRGATIAICGSAKVGVPEAVLAALGDRYRETGEPGDLTLYFPVEPGDRPGIGIDHLAQPGMLSCLLAGSYIFTGSGTAAKTTSLVMNEQIAAYNFPMGVMFLLLRDIAAGRPGHITDVGLGTFVDPEYGGGKLTSLAKRDLVERIEIDGRPYLRYLPHRIDVAIIRGTTADSRGNMTLEDETSLQGMLAMAQAAKASGGIVIAQVQRSVVAGTLRPHDVRVPGALVDVVVVDPEQEQLLDEPFRPELCGRVSATGAMKDTPTKLSYAAQVVVRRAVRELEAGGLYNLGFGMAANIPLLEQESLRDKQIQFFVEQGAIGGIPLPGPFFGASVLPDALMEMPSWFDFLEGGAFSGTFLGFGEADGSGSVNNHRLNGVMSGCGGFIDITTRVPRIVFCGTFTAGGLAVSWQDGALVVEREGRHRKFVQHIPAPTLSGPQCLRRNQRVTWITERAVLELTSRGLLVTEIAPGIAPADLEAAADCELHFADDLVQMDAELFAPASEEVCIS